MVNYVLFNEKCKYSLTDFEFLHDPADKNCKLGAGSFAHVKLAKEKKTGKLLALKIVRLSSSKPSASEIYNIKVEIFIHRKLNHANIIKFHDYIPGESTVHLVLDYAENGNLYTYLHRKKYLAEKEAFKFFYQTCLAVQYLHLNDVIHRDIKPENLLLDNQHNIKLCDFGWATQNIREKRLTFCGTYEYMAPEIVYKRPYDYRVDIWSLGVLLYELLHSESPYKGRSLPEIMKALSRGVIKFSSNCPPEAKDLIQKILKQNPNDRLNLSQILSHPWVTHHLNKDQPNFSLPIPREKVLMHSNSLPLQPKEVRLSPLKENRDPLTATHSQSRVNNYDNWSDYVKKMPQEVGGQAGFMRAPNNLKSYAETAKINSTHLEDTCRKPLQPCNSNITLCLDLKNIDDNSTYAQTRRILSPSPPSPILSNNATPKNFKTPLKFVDNHHTIFEKNIFSPSFKSKLTSVIRQLTVQPANQSASQNTRRDELNRTNHTAINYSNQNASMLYNPQSDSMFHATATSRMREDKENINFLRHDLYDSNEDKSPSQASIHSFPVNTFLPRQEVHPNQILDNMKANFKEHLSILQGDDYPVTLASTTITQTNISDTSYGPDLRSPYDRSNKECSKGRYLYRNEREAGLAYTDRNRSAKHQMNGCSSTRERVQGASNKKAYELKGILGPEFTRFQVPIGVSTLRQVRNKENLL